MVVAALVQTTSAFSSPIISVATTTTAAASPSKASSSSSTAAASAAVAAASSNPKALLLPLEPKNVVNCVAVAGATGRTGRVVVQELLARGIKNVVALTRDETYAAEIFPDPAENLQLLQCDLSNDRQLQKGEQIGDFLLFVFVFVFVFEYEGFQLSTTRGVISNPFVFKICHYYLHIISHKPWKGLMP